MIKIEVCLEGKSSNKKKKMLFLKKCALKNVQMPPVSRIGPQSSEPLNLPDFAVNLMEDLHITQFC